MAAPTAPVLGCNGKLYRNSGTYGTPTFALISNVRNIVPHIAFTEVDVSARAGGGMKMSEPGLFAFDAEIEGMYDPADTEMTGLQTAALARTSKEFFFLDQIAVTAGSSGLRVTCKIFDWKRTEDLDGVMSFTFALKGSYAANAASYYTVA